MTGVQLRWPGTTAVSLLAGLATWTALWAWGGFVQRPSGFLLPTLVTCLLVAVSGMLMRSARVPALLVPLGQLALLLIWLSHRWAEVQSILGWIPTAASIHEVGLRVQAGATAAQQFAAPVPEGAPQIYPLLIVAGAGAAVVIDFLACGLRRVPAAGLPLLAMYTAPVSILDSGVPWWTFVAGAVSFLFLLSSEESRRLSNWGRQISGTGRVVDTVGTSVSPQTVRASTRKIGFTATGLAVVIPIFVPTLSSGLFSGDGPGPGGTGDGVTISNPIVDLKRDLTRGQNIDLVEVQTTDPNPSHLRISVLDTFDGDTWKPSQRDIIPDQKADGAIPRPAGLTSGVPQVKVPYTIRTTPEFKSQWLPTPFPAASVVAEGDWHYVESTLDFISAGEETADGLEYTADALLIEPSAQSLANANPAPEQIFTPYTALPDSMPDIVPRLARQVTAGATSRFEKAVLLQDWFREDGGFTYSLKRAATGSGTNDLVAFLSDGPGGRVGYCEQFAAAMAVMGRSIGIPSRVAVGFLEPTRVDDDTYMYRAHDLHAWPEMYFQGAGWIRFEPTPQDRASGVPGYTLTGLPQEQPSAAPSASGPIRPQDNPDRRAPTRDAIGGGGQSDSTGNFRDRVIGVLVVLLVMALLAAPRAIRSWHRRRRWAGATSPVEAAEAAWSELRASALDLGIPWDDSVTLRTRARALAISFGAPATDGDDRRGRSPVTGANVDPDASRALERLVQWVERARYARSLDEVRGLEEDVELCVTALRNGVSRRRQLRADWLPASLLRGLGTDTRRRSGRTGLVGPDAGVDHAI